MDNDQEIRLKRALNTMLIAAQEWHDQHIEYGVKGCCKICRCIPAAERVLFGEVSPEFRKLEERV